MHYDLVTSLQTMFPWLEYIVRVGWTEDGGQVWAQVLDRSQQRLELILIPESQFERSSLPKLGSSFESNGPGSPGYGGPAGSEAAPAPIQVITSEQSEWWVSVHDILKFLPHPDPGQVKFLWASEETGYRHLYLVVASVATPAGSGTGDTAHLCPRIVSRVALTSGDWEVVNRQVWWDEKHQMVYFHALRDSCLERHLYCVSVNRPGEVSAARCWPRQLSVAMAGAETDRARVLSHRGDERRLSDDVHSLLQRQLAAGLPGVRAEPHGQHGGRRDAEQQRLDPAAQQPGQGVPAARAVQPLPRQRPQALRHDLQTSQRCPWCQVGDTCHVARCITCPVPAGTPWC